MGGAAFLGPGKDATQGMADLESLLHRTSRTFALAIPELPQPTRREVEIAYLLFRIADTFEDATRWPPAMKAKALADFERLLDPANAAQAGPLARAWSSSPPVDHEGYVELLGETVAVLEALASLRPEAQQVIRSYVARTSAGMAEYAGRPGTLQLGSVQELRDYCYVVAGIVGEMLTELFILGRPGLVSQGAYLNARARWFGEGLQLTNILKDAGGDAVEGRIFLPEGKEVDEIFAVAREDLRQAEEYVRCLEGAGAPKGIVAFNALPVLLAWGTLDRVEAKGPGAKLSRPEVIHLVTAMHRALAMGDPVMAVGAGGATGA